MRKFAKTQILEWKFGWKVKLKCTGPQPRIFEGRTGFFEQKLFDKHFMHGIQKPNGHSTLNRRHFDVDITWIRNIRPNFDEFPRHFHVIFWRNFDGRKFHVVSTYFFRCNFDGRKIRVVSTHFYDVISMVKKSTLLPSAFFDVIPFIEISTVFLLTFFDVILMVE